ncbi:MAG: hypothetical protein RLZZ314_1518 [Bacteroidota bacterium]
MSKERAFEVVRASAGSGKTYRLVSRYLASCLAEDDALAFRHILALTFTNKAAWEMKERILRDLFLLGSGDAKQEFVQELVDQTGASPEVLAARARHCRAAMLQRYSSMSVMTLDSFTNRLVRSFARDLALDQDFRIELDQDRIVEEAVSNVLDRVGEPGNEAFTELLRGFARLRVEEEKDSRIRKPLMSYGTEVLKEGMRAALEAVSDLTPEDFRRLSSSLRQEVKAKEKILRDLAQRAQEAFQREGVERTDVSRGSMVDFVNALAEGTFKVPSPTLRAQFESGHFTKQSATPEVEARVSKVRDDVDAVYQQVMRMLPETEEGRAFVLRQRLIHKIDLMGTIAVLAEAVEEVQVSRNVRTFHALHERVAKVVRGNPVPFLFERMGNRYRHVFIDEFQDTSVRQWQNLVPLFDHVLAERQQTLVVGDGKQAIYRWRNGDYRQLLALPDMVDDEAGDFADVASTFRQTIHVDVLEDNWRSGRSIVDWNNRFFAAVQGRLPEGVKAVYDQQAQHPRQPFEGAVFVHGIAGEDKDDREAAMHHALIERLRHHHSEQGGGFAWSEMAVLVRTNKEGARLAQRMLDADITPQTEDSLHLGRHPAALAVVHLTRWIVQPAEHRHATAWLQCVAALEPDRIHESSVLDAFVSPPPEGKRSPAEFRVLEMLDALYPTLDVSRRAQGPLVSWIGHACQVLGVVGRFDAYAEGLMELALNVTGTEDNGLAGFIRAWDRQGHKRSIVTSGGGHAVQVMTVHKAKGLAFPVTLVTANASKARDVRGVLPEVIPVESGVHVPAALLSVGEMKGTMLEHRAEAELDASLLDQINILYVAMTRPVERLDVFAEIKRWDFNRDMPQHVGEWVLACAEDITGHTFEESQPMWGIPSLERQPHSSPKNPPVREEVVSHLRLGEWSSQRVSAKSPHWGSIQPSGLTDKELGVIAHGLLEQVIVAEDWTALRQRVARRWSLAPEDASKVVAWIDGVLSHEASARFFAPGHEVECEPRWTDGHETKRPDRVVFDGSTWHIIDFKTGSARPSKHAAQVREYMNILKTLEDMPVQGWVLYLDPWALEAVADTAQGVIFETN